MATQRRSLGMVIRDRRLALGWSQEELATRASALGGALRQSDISRMERGKIGLPRYDRLVDLADALALPVGELLTQAGWNGADRLIGSSSSWLDVAGEPAALAPEPEPAASRPGRPTERDPRLWEAITQAQQTRNRTRELLQRCSETWRLANQPLQVAPPSTEFESGPA